MKKEIMVNNSVKVIADTIVGDFAGQSNLKGKEGQVYEIIPPNERQTLPQYLVRFFDGTPNAWFFGDDIEYLGEGYVGTQRLQIVDIILGHPCGHTVLLKASNGAYYEPLIELSPLGPKIVIELAKCQLKSVKPWWKFW